VAVLAASSIGLSTALLSAVGVASAAALPTLVFDTDSANTDATTLHAGDPIDLPNGYCSINWTVTGAPGGAATDPNNDPGSGTEVDVTTPISGAQHFTFTLGAPGGPASTAGGTGGLGGHGADGTAGTDDGAGNFGGGGGGATTVDSASGLFLEAPGGDGAVASGTTGGGAGGGTVTFPSVVTPDRAPGPGNPSAALQVTANPCAPAPTVSYLEGGDRSLDFSLARDPNGTDQIDATQYSIDGGTTWTNVDAPTSDDLNYSGTITGLATGHAYSVKFRFHTADGPGMPSAAKSATTYFPAPTNLKATVGNSSITFSWSPPADATGVTGYVGWAIPEGAQSSGAMIPCPAMDASARTCTVTVPSGSVYWVGVAASGAGSNPDNPGNAASLKTDVVPAAGAPTTGSTTTGSQSSGSPSSGTGAVSAPATVPTGSGPLSSGTGAAPTTLTAGQKVPLSGSGYAPNSAVSLYIYSTPTLLGTVTTDAQGSFATTVTIPATLAPGTHHLVSAGVDPSGNVRYLRSDVTVTTPSGQLAWTGFETTPVVLAGGLAVLLGIVLVVVTRRRRTA
jgi:hypothetical protein